MTKDIQNNNVTVQINAKDFNGKPLRVAECDVFVIHFFTDDPKRYLTFSKRDFLMTEFVDEITIPRHQMERLNSGVLQYTIDYLPYNHNCVYEETGDDCENKFHLHHKHHLEENLIHTRPIVSDIYWRNIHHPHPSFPLNSVTLFDIERLQREIDAERISREKDIEDLQNQFGEGFSDKLDAEIERSKNEDEKINATLDALGVSLGELGDSVGGNQEENKSEITQNKVDIAAETARATAKEIQLQQAIDGEVSRAKSEEEVIKTSLQMEKERATANEANINDRLVSLTDRFEANKELVGETLKSEIERAKATESALNEKIQGVVNDLAVEVSRSAQKDIDHTNLVVTEANRAEAVENKIATDLETEINRAKDAEQHLLDEVHSVQNTVSNLATATNVYTKSEVDNKVNQVKNDVDTINNWIGNHSNDVDALNVKVNGIVADVDKAKADILQEVAKCDAENNKQATDLKTLSDSVYTKAETDGFVNDLNSSIASLENWKENHNDNTEGLSTRVSNLENDVNVAKSDILAEVAKCDAENDKLAVELKTLSDNVYNKSEVDTKVNDLNNSISSLENWKQNHSDNTEGLIEKVNKLVSDTEKLNADLSTETTNRINADTTLETKVSVAEGKTDAECVRAKAQEKLIEDKVDEFKISSDAKHAELSDSIAETNANLTLEIAERKAQDKVINDALEIINGDVETSGSIKKSLADGKAYTDAEIAKAKLANDVSLAQTLVDYATVTEVDRKISEVIGTAPEALDTLGKISSALSQDNDAISAINEVLSGKANSEDVYNKNEIDVKVTAINNSVSTLETKVDNADATINGRIDDLVAKVSGIETNVDTNNSTLSDAITAEETARKSADKTISDKLDSEIAKVTDKVNELNAKVIDDIANSSAKDTELEASISALNTLLTNVETKVDNEVIRATDKDNELVAKDTELEAKINANTLAIETESNRSKQVEKELNDKINSITIPDLTDVNSSISAVNDKIDSEISTARANEKILSDKIDAVVIPDAVDLTPVNNAISTLDNKVDNVQSTLQTNLDNEISTARANEKANADNISALQTSVSGINDSIASVNASITQLQADSSAKDTEIENNINTEKNRAENAEKLLSDKIDIINGDKEIIGSIAHAVEDAKHHIDDKLADYQPKGDYLTEHQSLDNYYTKSEVDQAIADVDVSEQLKDYATKSEVEEAIAEIDVTEQLKDYARKDECSIIRDENGNKLDLVIDFSDNTPTDGEGIPVYNEQECDAKFATKEELAEAIANIEVGETDLSNYYDKTYIDGVVSTVNNSLNSKLPIDSFNVWSENVATKTYVDNAISEIEIPETDLSDYYTKEQANSYYATKTQVSAKADAINVYSKNDTYTKTEVNNLINNIIKTYTEEEFEALTDEEKNNGIVIVL